MIKAIIFDFDGVIADTFDFAYKINHQLFPELTVEEYRSLFEGNINDHRWGTISDEERQKHNEHFFSLYQPELMKLGIVPGMDKVIKEWSQKYQLFIVSSTNTNVIQGFLEREGLLPCFSKVLGNDVAYSKVEKIETLKQKYGLEGQNLLFITDTLGDIVEAAKCEVKSIAVTWGYHPIETLQKGHPYKIINSIDELIEIV